MIYTDREHLARYRGISESLDTALDYLMEHGTDGLMPGRNEVDGDEVFINRFHYTTMPQEEAAFEAHAVSYTHLTVCDPAEAFLRERRPAEAGS